MKYLTPLFKVALKYALTASVLAIVVLLLLFYTGRHPLLISIAYDYRILLFGVFIFFSIKEFKTYGNNGELHFWQGLLIGIFFYLLLGLVVGAFIWMFSEIEPRFLAEYIEGTIRGLLVNKEQLTVESKVTITEEEFNKQIELMRETKSFEMALDYFIKSCLIGFFLSVLLSVILRKTNGKQ